MSCSADDPRPPAAKRACAAWWGSFGGSADPEGEWEGLDETERHYWLHIAEEATLDGDAEKYLLQAKGALASLKSFVADVTVAVEVAASKVEAALALLASMADDPRPPVRRWARKIEGKCFATLTCGHQRRLPIDWHGGAIDCQECSDDRR